MKIELTYHDRTEPNVKKVVEFVGHAHRATESAMSFIIIHAPLAIINVRVDPVAVE